MCNASGEKWGQQAVELTEGGQVAEGMEGRGEQEGEIDASIPDDGAGKGDEEPDEEQACQGE